MFAGLGFLQSCSSPLADHIWARYYNRRSVLRPDVITRRDKRVQTRNENPVISRVVYAAKISGRHRFRWDFHPDGNTQHHSPLQFGLQPMISLWLWKPYYGIPSVYITTSLFLLIFSKMTEISCWQDDSVDLGRTIGTDMLWCMSQSGEISLCLVSSFTYWPSH